MRTASVASVMMSHSSTSGGGAFSFNELKAEEGCYLIGGAKFDIALTVHKTA